MEGRFGLEGRDMDRFGGWKGQIKIFTKPKVEGLGGVIVMEGLAGVEEL